MLFRTTNPVTGVIKDIELSMHPKDAIRWMLDNPKIPFHDVYGRKATIATLLTSELTDAHECGLPYTHMASLRRSKEWSELVDEVLDERDIPKDEFIRKHLGVMPPTPNSPGGIDESVRVPAVINPETVVIRNLRENPFDEILGNNDVDAGSLAIDSQIRIVRRKFRSFGRDLGELEDAYYDIIDMNLTGNVDAQVLFKVRVKSSDISMSALQQEKEFRNIQESIAEDADLDLTRLVKSTDEYIGKFNARVSEFLWKLAHFKTA